MLVIGGGVNRRRVALDAATRGLRTALVEMRDLAAARRRARAQLFHGGLRYLEQLNVGLLRESLHERELMLTRLAPHLVHPVPFLYPLRHRGGSGAVRRSRAAALRRPRGALERAAAPPPQPHRRPCAVPGAAPDALVGALQYYDAQADDAVTPSTVARTAAHYGATVRTSTKVVAGAGA